VCVSICFIDLGELIMGDQKLGSIARRSCSSSRESVLVGNKSSSHQEGFLMQPEPSFIGE
jgi:hypothetical protein